MAAAVGLVTAPISGPAIMDAHTADPRLDAALAALQKAQALLDASEAGVVSKQVPRQFQRHVDRAIALIDRIAEQIEAAKDVVDTP